MKSSNKPLYLAAVATLVAACGGGGGGSGSTADGTAVTSGAITAFGSIVVNGRHLEVSGPAVAIRQDDDTLGETELELGDFVRVRDDDDGREVEVEEAVRGPVDSVDAADGTLTVMGQAVLTDAGTVFDDNPASDLASLNPGDVVEVHGLRDENDAISATRVEKEQSPGELKVTGTVNNHLPAGESFEIGGLVVDYSSAAEVDDDLPAGSWDGLIVEVEAQSGNYAIGPPKTLLAREVDREDPVGAAAGQLVEIERIVTAVNGDTITVSGGLQVDISGAEFELGAAAELVVGVRVEIEGRLRADGTLAAREIKFDDNDARLSGRVSNLDTGAGTFEVLGVTLALASNVEFENIADLSGLSNGDFVEVEGRVGPNGNVIAHEIERDDSADADEDLELRGPVSQKNTGAGTLRLHGVPVTIGGATELEIEDVALSRAAFFDRLVIDSTVVEIRWDGGTFTGTSDIPEKAEIEHEEDDD